ncbi:MAG: hypothetical protein AB8I08_27735 [Sandaracinaceae bacterium]
MVTALDGDVNPRRVERYVTAVWDGGAAPVVLLNKVDLGAVDEIETAIASGSAPTSRGIRCPSGCRTRSCGRCSGSWA